MDTYLALSSKLLKLKLISSITLMIVIKCLNNTRSEGPTDAEHASGVEYLNRVKGRKG